MLFVCVSCLRFLLSRALFLSVTCSHGVRIDRSWRRRRRRVSVIWWAWVEGWAGWWASAPRWDEKREGEGKGVLVDTQSSQWLTGSEWAPTGKLVLTLSPFARVKLSRECLWCVREGEVFCAHSWVSEENPLFSPRARFLCGYCYLRSTSRWPTITIISNNFILSLCLPLSTGRRHRRKSLFLFAIVVCDQLGIKLPTAKKVKKFFSFFLDCFLACVWLLFVYSH